MRVLLLKSWEIFLSAATICKWCYSKASGLAHMKTTLKEKMKTKNIFHG